MPLLPSLSDDSVLMRGMALKMGRINDRREVAEILPSRMRDYILLRIKPFSETNIMV